MRKLVYQAGQAIPRPVKQALKRVIHRGNKRFCPVCGSSVREFLPFGLIQRPHAKCPICGSLERHRFVWRYFEQRTDLFTSQGKKMLHVAAEPCFEPQWRRRIGDGYLTADLLLPADVKMDICDIQYPDSTFDIVYCSHVLEHVPDDRLAMREFFRVLKPDGWAAFLVPITIEKTIEDPTITDPQERERLFGQIDHVRRYGPDFVDRLREAGFSVQTTNYQDLVPEDQRERLGLGSAAGDVFHCTKAR